MMAFVLIDTNILLRCADPAHPMYKPALDAQVLLRIRGDTPCIVAQNLIEFRSVATRPIGVNGLGMSQSAANLEISLLQSLYPLFLDEPTILKEWERLATLYGAAGKQNHDARIVASMNVHEINTILTFNRDDFIRYAGLTVLVPGELLASS